MNATKRKTTSQKDLYRMSNSSNRNPAFTLLELLFVLVTLIILAVMVIPALARTGSSVARLTCAANLKQIGLAFQNWRNAHLSLYPMTVLNTAGGPPVGAFTLSTWAGQGNSTVAAQYEYTVFGVMSNELSTPKIVVCPSDERTTHSNFTMRVTIGPPQVATASNSGNNAFDTDAQYFNNFKLSYFLGVNASDLHPQMFLAGDRNVWGDHTGSTTAPGWPSSGGYGNNFGTQYCMGTNWATGATWPQWTPGKMHQGRGNVVLADSSVQQLDSVRLRQQLSATGDTTRTSGTSSGPNTLLFP